MNRRWPSPLEPGDYHVVLAWVGAAFAGMAIARLVLAPMLKLIWIVLLVFAVATIPQSILAGRAEKTRRRNR